MASVSRAERAARNEALFREVNEKVKDVAMQRFGESDSEFFCECSDHTCTRLVAMSLSEYERVRARGARFAIVVGHEDPAVERVVEQNERFAVVEKFGESAEVAELLNPRDT